MFPTDWYWIVADGPAGSVYASKHNDYVSDTDADYQSWVKQPQMLQNIPTAIDTEFNLGVVLSAYPLLRPIPQGVLDGFQSARAEQAVLDPLFPVEIAQANDIRALQGLPPLSPDDFKKKIRALQ